MNWFTNADEVFAFTELFANLERGAFSPRLYRLERMGRLLADFGNPERTCEVTHVAGSKGKGSVSAYIASIYAMSGRSVGLYMSPHVMDYRERITLLGPGMTPELRDELIVTVGNEVREYVERKKADTPTAQLPTSFELLTLIAFMVFRTAGIAHAVIEVGLGGRLDATNLVRPAVTVITAIELEHTDYLGNTIESVATEKGGIIKEGIPLVLGKQPSAARDVLQGMAGKASAPVIAFGQSVHVSTGSTSLAGTAVSLKVDTGSTRAEIDATLRMLGGVQAVNAGLAAAAVLAVHPETDPQVIADGLAATWLPGRAEIWPGHPPILLDGAHTPDSVRTVLAVADELEPEPGRRVLIFGSVKGKKHTEMLAALGPAFSSIIIARPGTFKESDVAEVFEACKDLGFECELIEEMDGAIAAARKKAPGLIVVTGSFHLIGEARRMLESERRLQPPDATDGYSAD